MANAPLCPRRLLVGSVVSLFLLAACKPSHGPAERPHGPFSVHEWGLIGADIRTPAHGDGAAGTQGAVSPRRGFGGTGDAYKPVVYVHLDRGVREARFSLAVGIGGERVPEHFPIAALDATSLRFAPIVATRGACDSARLTPPPTADSPACQTADGFCEAVEIPRYTGDRDVCLTTRGQSSELLFYRARALDVSRLPLSMAAATQGYTLQRSPNVAVAGPVLFVSNEPHEPTLRLLAPTTPSGPIGANAREISGPEARTLLVDHARSLGLTSAEADAMIDAWAPALFEASQRSGAEAAGTPPASLTQVDASLLYFAPRSLVDAMLPLSTDPPARAVERVFLVRVVDGSRPTESRGWPGASEAGGNLGDRGPALPTVRPAGNATFQGPLTGDQVRRVILRNIAKLYPCYEHGLERDPALAGRAVIAFTIGLDGRVTEVHIERSTMEAPNDEGCLMPFEQCLTSAFSSFTFPVVDPPAQTTATFPMNFSMTGG